MNEILIKLLQQNRDEKVGRGGGRWGEVEEDRESRCHQLWLSIKKQSGKLRQCNILTESSNDESSDEEEDDGTTCKICEIPWIELTEECGDWVECNICKEYICPKCYDKRDIYADFFVVFATDPKY